MLGSVYKQTITHTNLVQASVKTTATEQRKLGLIIKMCQVRVQQLFLFNKPCSFTVWLALLGYGLSLHQALIKHPAFVTKWRTISLALLSPLL